MIDLEVGILVYKESWLGKFLREEREFLRPFGPYHEEKMAEDVNAIWRAQRGKTPTCLRRAGKVDRKTPITENVLETLTKFTL